MHQVRDDVLNPQAWDLPQWADIAALVVVLFPEGLHRAASIAPPCRQGEVEGIGFGPVEAGIAQPTDLALGPFSLPSMET